MKPSPFLYTALLLLSQCHKKDPSPESQLPPATQTGADTFGCLVNGQPWMPQGSNGYPNFGVSYDAAFHGGNLSINTYRLNNNYVQYIILGGDSIRGVGTYSLSRLPRSVYFTDTEKVKECQIYDGSSSQYRRGTLTVTRLDLAAGVIAGTFAFTLYKPGCDSIRVTNGRFDAKL